MMAAKDGNIASDGNSHGHDHGAIGIGIYLWRFGIRSGTALEM
jgi:hypothetical protein